MPEQTVEERDALRRFWRAQNRLDEQFDRLEAVAAELGQLAAARAEAAEGDDAD